VMRIRETFPTWCTLEARYGLSCSIARCRCHISTPIQYRKTTAKPRTHAYIRDGTMFMTQGTTTWAK
jgi:hypothetical protein